VEAGSGATHEFDQPGQEFPRVWHELATAQVRGNSASFTTHTVIAECVSLTRSSAYP